MRTLDTMHTTSAWTPEVQVPCHQRTTHAQQSGSVSPLNMCINSRAEIFALSVMCAVYNVAYILIHAMNYTYYGKFKRLHGTYMAVYAMGLITDVLLFVSVITRRTKPMQIGVFLCKGKIAIASMEIGYLAYRFYHVSYIGMETCMLIIDVYTTWRLDIYVDKVLSRRLFLS
ncbi:hypothetical protein HPB50_003520 [Hyalomma asiaticum]|uniref:Uncharacterized protein n=1 Tax=Hyalomma asiaticum TaxID=266040 RepID=A0ACB7RV45_HYAAI|nr:hypothetical protein HPB50_003520 [Hyalomma asiaticum]